MFLLSLHVVCAARPCRPHSPNLATDHPQIFKKDVVERAEHYAAGLTGGVGAYTNSQGIPAVREVHHEHSTFLNGEVASVSLLPCIMTTMVLPEL